MIIARKHWLVALAAAGIVLITFNTSNSNISFPVPGNTGDPTSSPAGLTCAQCHAGGIHNGAGLAEIMFANSSDTVSIDSFKYKAGQLYTVSFRSKVTAARHGFQLSALSSGNNNAGALAATNAKTIALPGPPPKAVQYISHQEADTTNNWQFSWTAPAAGTGNVTFYYAFIAANNNNGNDGDTVYATTNIVQADTTGTSIERVEEFERFSVFPTHAKQSLTISFNTEAGLATYATAIYALDGRLVSKHSFTVNDAVRVNQAIQLDGLNAGVYLLQVSAGNRKSVRKIVVE